jgi:hypothetical protein
MSQLGCICGHRIADTTDSLAYKGHLLKDQDSEPFWETAARELAAFAEAAASGQTHTWIDMHFLPEYPRDLDSASMISDFLAVLWSKYAVTLYECEGCGRLNLQEGTTSNMFVSFAPDDGRFRGVLASEHNVSS